MGKEYLIDWLVDALKCLDGRGSITEICKYVWDNHEGELRNMGDAFYTWQYDIRWAATELRNNGIIKSASLSPKGIWELTNKKMK